MALYEAVFIARQDLTAENVDSLSDKLSEIITSHKGKIIKKEYWGLRNLAYKINKSLRGHYVCLNIESEDEGLTELKRIAGLNEDIIRSNIFVVKEHAKEPSELMVSATAKDYKPEPINKKDNNVPRTAFAAEVAKINLNV
jgi:small subunit ribosomal protein S6